MSGDQFSSRQAAIDDANKCMLSKWGDEVSFPDRNDGSLVHNTLGLTAAWGFRVVDQVGRVIAHYVVFSKGKDFIWQEVEASAT